MTNTPSSLSEQRLEKIRTGQKFVLYGCLIGCTYSFLLKGHVPDFAEILITLPAWASIVFGGCRLVVGLYTETSKRVLGFALMVCSFGVVALAIAVRSSRVLKENGYKVGLLGAGPKVN